MDIRTKTGLIIQKNGEYLVACQIGTGNLVWSASPWDAWITRSREDAESVLSLIGGELFLFKPRGWPDQKGGIYMTCPQCDNLRTYIIETREDNEYSVRRRRKCPSCGFRFTTYERMAQMGFIHRK